MEIKQEKESKHHTEYIVPLLVLKNNSILKYKHLHLCTSLTSVDPKPNYL